MLILVTGYKRLPPDKGNGSALVNLNLKFNSAIDCIQISLLFKPETLLHSLIFRMAFFETAFTVASYYEHCRPKVLETSGSERSDPL